MNTKSMIYADGNGTYTVVRNLSGAPLLQRGRRVSAGDVFACIHCTRPIYMGGRVIDQALRGGEEITVPCRCGHEYEIDEKGRVTL